MLFGNLITCKLVFLAFLVWQRRGRSRYSAVVKIFVEKKIEKYKIEETQ